MATVPLSGTNIALYSGIPFQNDYKHTRWFDSLADQLNWFASQTHVATIAQANFQRIEGKNFFRVNMSIDQLWNVNYFSFQNADYAKVFYAFVTELEYLNNGATNVHFEIDVVQTWRFEMDFKPSFVAREHCPLWNTDGTPVINTVPENLNYGTEYDTVYVNNIQANSGYKFLVILVKGTMHNGGNGTQIIPVSNGVPTPLTTYFIPFQIGKVAPQVQIDNPNPLLPANGTMGSTTDVLKTLYLMQNGVGNIVSLYITDHIGLNVTVQDGNGTADIIHFQSGSQVQIVNVTDPTDNTKQFNCMYLLEVDTYATSSYFAGDKYLGYKPVTESKLLMYPYTNLILEDFKGNRVTYKTEYINNANLWVNVKGSLGVSNKTSYGFEDYNADIETYKLEAMDEFSVINNEPNDVPIIDSNLPAFLQGHKNTIANQRSSILFNGALDVAGGGAGMAGAIAQDNVMGAIQSGLSAVRGAGNTQLQLQAINAKLADIKNVPPNIVKMGSNSAYTFGNNYAGVYIIKKQIKDEYIKKLTDYFNMYGYQLNEVKIPNFHTRQSWNYVQTVGCVIRASINNEDIDELKAVFDNGITLWHVDDIGNYTLSNGVL